jgi:hypothetical protein
MATNRLVPDSVVQCAKKKFNARRAPTSNNRPVITTNIERAEMLRRLTPRLTETICPVTADRSHNGRHVAAAALDARLRKG